MDSRFLSNSLLIRKKVLTLVGAKFEVFDPNEQIVMFSKMKGFKLKEDIRIYTSEDMTEELITITARNIIDFSGTYDVVDAKTGVKIGSLKRKGMKSMIKDEWIILNGLDVQIGLIKEDNLALALLRRFISGLIPQTFHVYVNDQVVALFKRNFNPFVSKLNMDFSQDSSYSLDRKLAVAAGILICALEQKQN